LLCDDALKAFLGSNLRINFIVKAHHVIDYLQRLKQYMQTLIPVTSDMFPSGQKWSILDISCLLKYLLQLPKYQEAFKNETKVKMIFLQIVNCFIYY
jgi:hypothetical protein